ncbi:glutamate racemase [Thalassolituus sp. LLYu03]|uniref:glutamate racemase n=1 Tax=Thalassolituus sp. LLYu03 TaxID=3421656 RepID=UPI003D2D57E9
MNPSILIFDSGVGGLSILQEIRQRLPGADLHYLMDNAFFPYGVKADDVLVQRIVDVCSAAVADVRPDLLVVACNTASTLALHALRNVLTVPVVGVVPAIKVAAGLTSSGHIGLLATPATVNRPYTDRLVEDFAAHCTVHRFGSAELVLWAETFLNTGTVDAKLTPHLQRWIDQQPQMLHVVLGCTHFPLLRDALEQRWPQIQWIDSGAAIARRVETLLAGRGLEARHGILNCRWTGADDGAQGALRFLQALGTVQQASVLSVGNPIQQPSAV